MRLVGAHTSDESDDSVDVVPTVKDVVLVTVPAWAVTDAVCAGVEIRVVAANWVDLEPAATVTAAGTLTPVPVVVF